MNLEPKICLVCGTIAPGIQWTDIHGVATCDVCGLTYQIIFYENGKPVKRSAETTVKDEWLPLLKKYWQETGRKVLPGSHCLPGSNCDHSTDDDKQHWSDWLSHHSAEWPR